MQTVEFLRGVLPEGSWYFAAKWIVNKDYARGGYMVHTAHNTIENLAADVIATSDEGTTSYFALASYAQPSYIGDDGKTKRREKENAEWVKSTWMDLDCGPGDDKPYKTQRDALAALSQFIKDSKLPKPTYIVSSGGGLHIYWTFKQRIPAKLWIMQALKLKTIASKLGLKADPSRTADVVSVLRPVGANNYKLDVPRPVELLRQYDEIGIKTWVNRLRELEAELGVFAPDPPSATKRQRKANDDLLGGEIHLPSDAERIADRCPTIAAMRLSEGADQEEPLWFACIGVLIFTEQSDAICHAWSTAWTNDKGETYSFDACQAKIDQRRASGYGPTGCEYIREQVGSSCAGCTRKCKSPISLGYPDPVHAATEVIQPKDETEVDAEVVEVALPSIPSCLGDFRFDPSRGGLTRKVKDEDGNESWSVVCSAFPTIEYLYITTDGDHFAHLRTRTRPGVWEECDIPTAALAEGGRSLMKALGGRGGIVARDQQGLTKFMQTWYDNLRESQDLEVMRRQMGWQPDGSFVLGARRFLPDGSEMPCTLSKELTSIAEAHITAGELATQVDLLDALYNKHHHEPFQFVLAAGLGSVLLPLIHDGPIGIPIALWSAHSGGGKTTVCQAAVSLWGKHTGNGQQASADGITEYAVYVMAGMRRHLPTLVDETTMWEPVRVANFAYLYSQGVAKVQGSATGGLRDNTARNWSNFMFTTGNKSLIDTMEASIANCAPQVARVFEIEVPKLRLDAREGEIVRELWNHHGHIGERFIRFVVKNREKTQAAVTATYRRLIDEVDSSTDARFWLHTVACVIVANRIATRLGLFRWDAAALEAWSAKQVKFLRGLSNDLGEDLEDTLDRMLTDLKPQILVTDDWGRMPSSPATIHPEFRLASTAIVGGRYLHKPNTLYLATKKVRQWCAANRIPFRQFTDKLVIAGWLVDPKAKHALTAGTAIGAGMGQTRCWVLRPRQTCMLAVDNTRRDDAQEVA